MSTNVRTSAVLLASVHAAMCQVPASVLVAGHTSTSLATVAEQQLSAPHLLADDAVADLIASAAADDLAALAGTAASDQLLDLRERREQGAPLLASQAAQLLHSLSDALGPLEREALTGVVTRTLTEDLGAVTVRSSKGTQVTGVEARFNDGGCLLVAVEAGAVVTDQADASGRCEMRQHLFEEGLARRGVAVHREAADQHESDVGPLIATAARRGAPTLAEAVASFTTSGPTRATRRPAATARPTVSRREQGVGS